jgi:hypothetical protein
MLPSLSYCTLIQTLANNPGNTSQCNRTFRGEKINQNDLYLFGVLQTNQQNKNALQHTFH